MLNEDFSCCDFIKFYYNVKMQYKPKGRSLTIPFIFLITTFVCIVITNILISFTNKYS